MPLTGGEPLQHEDRRVGRHPLEQLLVAEIHRRLDPRAFAQHHAQPFPRAGAEEGGRGDVAQPTARLQQVHTLLEEVGIEVGTVGGDGVVLREIGLHRLERFREAGLEWADSGCSMCVGINGDLVAPGERCASTTNRNFRGRQGPGARTHLMSPAMVAAAAVSGHLADVRPFLAGRRA